MKTLIMNGCAKDGIEDIKTLSKQQNRRKKNVYVLIISIYYLSIVAIIDGDGAFITDKTMSDQTVLSRK